jgi:hypothetical protein
MPLQAVDPVPINIGGPAPPERPLAVLQKQHYVAQCQSNWCWAACYEMVHACMGLVPMPQCEIVAACYGGDCCTPPCNTMAANDPRNRPMSDSDTTGLQAAHLVCDARSKDTDKVWTFSPTELSAMTTTSPVQIRIRRPDGSGHVLMIADCDTTGLVAVFDPDHGIRGVRYNDLLNQYDGGAWTASFSNFGPRPNA